MKKSLRRSYLVLLILIFLFILYLYKWYFIFLFIGLGSYLIICDIESEMNKEDRLIKKKYNIWG